MNYQSIISRFISIELINILFILFSLAVANTDLIRYFLVYQPKLRAMLHAIRLWIKQKDLLGRGHRFNTYTLFWMIVCTLQLQDKQLPSVQSLAQSASKKRQHGPWNCSVPDIHQIEQHLSNTSIGNIPLEFNYRELFFSRANA